jgi:hypothetical protein
MASFRSTRVPDFLIVGAMRSGTTALARLLGAHPNIFLPAEKEIRFFDLLFDNGWEWYGEHFRGAPEDHAIGEATPSYMYDVEAMTRIGRSQDHRDPEESGRSGLLALLDEPIPRS